VQTRNFCFVGSLLALGIWPAPTSAQQPVGGGDAAATGAAVTPADQAVLGTADLASIRQAALDFATAFNSGDAPAIAAHWTEDAEYTDESGRAVVGRAAIQEKYAQFFAEHKGARIQIAIESLRLLSDCAAIEDGQGMLDPTPAGAPAINKYTAVHVKVNGKWLMTSVRETRIETPSGYRKLAELEWLIGTWTAEEHGAKTESVCRWVANKSFVERNYTVTLPDQTTTSGVQLIGFNPQGGHIQSWNFSSDGGYAVGKWTPRENGWTAENQGTLGDGTSTSSVNVLTRLDDNAYTWHSVQRTAGGIALPDTDEVVLKRRNEQQ
jgi:uncharacterized protein (TIGR02246 family)